MLHQISYETFCRFGALRNRLLSKLWCTRCGTYHYYADEGQLVYPSGPLQGPKPKPSKNDEKDR